MGSRDKLAKSAAVGEAVDAEHPLRALAPSQAVAALLAPGDCAPAGAIVIGELIAVSAHGGAPLVVYAGQPGNAALKARAVVDLHAAHVGHQVVLMFEAGLATRPIVMGVLRPVGGWPLAGQPGQVEVQSGGERLIVSAAEQLVLRCGKARLVLHKDGRIELKGETVVSEATGANRVRGGSVHLN